MLRLKLILALLIVIGFCVATYVDARVHSLTGDRARSGGVLEVLLGDGRRLFANHFFVKADVYFHSGCYPTIFDDRQAVQTSHLAEDAGAVEGQNVEEEQSFLSQPRDWIDRFNRYFFPAAHTHLDHGGPQAQLPQEGCTQHEPDGDVAEILPWLKLSARLDPKRVETYTVAAYWLRDNMGKADEAEAFLREGLRANPGSAAILFELGRIYQLDRKDRERARNLYELALRYWREQEANKEDPDIFKFAQITMHLAAVERESGHLEAAIRYLKMLQKVSPNPASIQTLVEAVEKNIPQEGESGTEKSHAP